MIFIDTNVLAAYYCPEPLSSLAQKALQEPVERPVSPHVELELTSAIARKVRTRRMRRKDAQRVLDLFRSHLEQGIYTRLGVDAAHFAEARDWITTFTVSLQPLDALHIAVAKMSGCSILTADAVLAKACTKVGTSARLIS